MDLRIVHPGIRVRYDPNVYVESANQILSYTFNGPSLASQNSRMRAAMATALRGAFGAQNVDDSGSRAIHVKALPNGGRAHLHSPHWFVEATRSWPTRRILSKDASRTFNYLPA
jgi:hypothetical protein